MKEQKREKMKYVGKFIWIRRRGEKEFNCIPAMDKQRVTISSATSTPAYKG